MRKSQLQDILIDQRGQHLSPHQFCLISFKIHFLEHVHWAMIFLLMFRAMRVGTRIGNLQILVLTYIAQNLRNHLDVFLCICCVFLWLCLCMWRRPILGCWVEQKTQTLLILLNLPVFFWSFLWSSSDQQLIIFISLWSLWPFYDYCLDSHGEECNKNYHNFGISYEQVSTIQANLENELWFCGSA